MKLIESRCVAWLGLLLTIILVVLTAIDHTPWWGYIAEFFLFIAMFSHLASLYLRRMSPPASRQLEWCALISIILGVVGFIIEYILFNLQY